jgi:hypothetical protein
MFVRLLSEEAGFSLSSEALLIATVCVLGLLVGVTTLRDSVVQEAGDFSVAIGVMNQSYEYSGVSDGLTESSGGTFSDTLDGSEYGAATPPLTIIGSVPEP